MVWDLGDVGIGLMTIFNMLALVPDVYKRQLLDICNAVDVPVVAIGGIHKENILQDRKRVV